jgi:FHA domain
VGERHSDLTDAETGVSQRHAELDVLPWRPSLDRSCRHPHLSSGSECFPLTAGENIIGRDASAAVRVCSIDVSRRHARITVDPDRIILEDLGSKNGTFVRGQRVVGPVELSDGDAICIGTTWLIFASQMEQGDDGSAIH